MSGSDTKMGTDQVRFDTESGLIPVVVQSAEDGAVLMLGYMNREALDRTLRDSRVTLFSRSRQRLWQKGETSGNWLEPTEILLDCDGDALLVRAVPHGPTCHTGRTSCFDRGALRRGAADGHGHGEGTAGGGESGAASGRVDRDVRVRSAALCRSLHALIDVVEERALHRPEGSYTVDLLVGGVTRVAQKVAEEAVEAALAAVADRERLAAESGDLLYHLVVLWRAVGLRPEAVAKVLQERRGEDPGSAG